MSWSLRTVFRLFVSFINPQKYLLLQMAQDFDLAGLVKINFDQDKLKSIFKNIHFTLLTHSKRIEQLESQQPIISVTQNSLSELSQRMALLSSEAATKTELSQLLNTQQQHLLQNKKILQSEVESRLQETQEHARNCTDFLRKQFVEVVENLKQMQIAMQTPTIQQPKQDFRFKEEILSIRQNIATFVHKYDSQRFELLQSVKTLSTRLDSQISKSQLFEPTKQSVVLTRHYSTPPFTPTHLNVHQVSVSPQKSQNTSATTALCGRIEALEAKMGKLDVNLKMSGRGLYSQGSRRDSTESAIQARIMRDVEGELGKTKKTMDALNQKNLLLEEQNKNLFNQLETIRVKFEHEYRNISRLLPMKIDEHNQYKTIISTEMGRQLQDYRILLDGKATLQDLEAMGIRFEEKLGAIKKQLTDKSDRDEVRRALIFLEAKLKDLILIVTQNQKDRKDALFTKTLLKCLSCDKEVDHIPPATANDFKPWKIMPSTKINPNTRYGLNSSSYARKRHHKDSREQSREESRGEIIDE